MQRGPPEIQPLCPCFRNVTQLDGRAPEVLFSHDGGEYSSNLPAPSSSVDLWSAGTVCAALHFGRKLFTGEDVTQQLQAFIDFLGPPAVAWPQVVHLRLWEHLSAKLTMRELQEDPCIALTGSALVRRPLPSGHPAIALVMSLLMWSPQQRSSAAQAAACPYFVAPLGSATSGQAPSSLVVGAAELDQGAPSPAKAGAATSSQAPSSLVDGAAELDQGAPRPAKAGAATEEKGSNLCLCQGGCGRGACSKMRTRRRRGTTSRVCSLERTVAGSRFCNECRCGMPACLNQRRGTGESRWCTKHQSLVDQGHYFVGGQVHELRKEWSEELKATAANSWWLCQQEVEPCDLTAFDGAFELEVAGGNMLLGQDSLLRLWAAAFMKWPLAIASWSAAAASARSERDWARAAGQVARAVDGNAMDFMHASISKGRMASLMGVQSFLQRLGQCHKIEQGQQHGSASIIVRLGKTQLQCRLSDSPAVWKEILRIRAPDITMPQTAEEFLEVMRALNAWFAKFPPVFSQGKGENAGYIRQHLLRKFALAMSRRAPRGAMGSIRWSDLRFLNPDQTGLTAAIDEWTTWQELEDRFGLHPLMISCWCCLLSQVPSDSWHLFVTPSAKLPEAVHQLRHEHEGVPPAPAALITQMGW